jgi:hypothetical protein
MAERKPLQQLAAEAAGKPQEIAGQPADKCPYCGAVMISYRMSRLKTKIIRYIRCRNTNCGKRFISHQAPATITDEVKKNQ